MSGDKTQYASGLFLRIEEGKRARILSIAVEEFATNGFAGASVNRIAREAGISIGALYKYFATKDDLFLYIIDFAAERIAAYVDAILNEDIRLLSKIEKLLRLAQRYSEEDPALIRLYSSVMAENDSARAEMIAGHLEGITAETYTALLRDAQEKGEVRSDIEPGVLAYMLDNQLINVQFSYACGYYMRRHALFLGERNARDNEFVIDSIMQVIKSMLEVK